jgi:hypothetical protein
MRKQKTGMKILTFFIQGLKLKRNGLRNLALICTVTVIACKLHTQ